MRGRARLARGGRRIPARPAAAHAAEAPWQDGGPGHRRPLRRPDRARPRRPRRGGRGRRARRATPTTASCATTLREADPAADEAIADGLRRRGRRPSTTTTRRRSPPPAAPSAPGSSAAPTRSITEADRARRRRDRQALAAAARVPHRDALHAPGRAGDARARPARAAASSRRRPPTQAVTKDLLDAYQARLRELLADARRGIEQDLPARRAEAAAQAAGYFAILAPRYAEDRGAAAEAQASAAFAALPDGRRRARRRARRAPTKSLEGFTAAPFTPEEAARRAQQLLQFLALVPVEYGRGVKGDQRHARLRDHRGGRVPHRRRRRVRRPARPAGQARPRPAPRRGAAALTELGRLVEIATKQQGGRRRPTSRSSTVADAGRERAQGRDAARPGRRRPTSPTTT